MLSLMWSEHCAYKHSRKLLRRLPTEGPHVLMGPGENAGAVDVGGGLAVAFKVESHNHPSAVEPFQGPRPGSAGSSATCSRSARGRSPCSTRCASASRRSERSRYLLERAVAGIGHYGNSIGVPTVGGEIYFERSYEQNCLVNAMCLGLAPHERLIRAAAAGPGNVVVLLGALTGRDGIGGASVLASAELGEGDEAKRPSVQIGDPFAEKKLLECCLELLDRELLVSLQDLGAAGLTSSASEMASKGEVGIDIDVSRVPLREGGMEPFEIMVSESQERMLCVVEPERVGAVLERVRALGGAGHADRLRHRPGDRLRVLDRGVAVAELPVGDPRRRLPAVRPRAGAARARVCIAGSAGGARGTESPSESLLALLRLGEHRLAPARVRAVRPGRAVAHGAPARRGRRRGAGAARRCARWRSRSTATAAGSPATRARGAAEAVYECAANLACVGAEPLGLTNCLNFGNPEKPHVAWQLIEAVAGLAEACEALGVPVVGGNVSLYNEAPTGPIFPTPVVGIVGRLPDAERAGRLGFARRGRCDRAGRAVRALARRARSWRSCGRAPRGRAARRRRARCCASARGGSRGGSLGRSRSATTSPRAASPSRSPSAASPDDRCHRELPDAARSVRRGPGQGFIVSGPARGVCAEA